MSFLISLFFVILTKPSPILNLMVRLCVFLTLFFMVSSLLHTILVHLPKFIIILLDYILIFSETLEEKLMHIYKVFQMGMTGR